MVIRLSQRHLSVLYIGFIINVSFQKTVICCRIYALVRYGFKDILTLRISLISSFNGNTVHNTVKNWTNHPRNVLDMNHKLFRVKDINSRHLIQGRSNHCALATTLLEPASCTITAISNTTRYKATLCSSLIYVHYTTLLHRIYMCSIKRPDKMWT